MSDGLQTGGATAHRLEQRRALVQRVVVALRGPDAPPVRVRAYVPRRALSSTEAGGTGTGAYLEIEEVGP